MTDAETGLLFSFPEEVDDEPIEDAPVTDKDQFLLFEADEWWRKEWRGMPEFIQEDLSPRKSIYVHFADTQDMLAFAELVGQTITSQTQSIWYPKAEIWTFAEKRYVSES